MLRNATVHSIADTTLTFIACSCSSTREAFGHSSHNPTQTLAITSRRKNGDDARNIQGEPAPDEVRGI